MYQHYEMDYTSAAPTTTSMMLIWVGSNSSFLSELAMLDDNEDTFIQEQGGNHCKGYVC